MTGLRTVECERHGPQPETFVCQHIVLSLHTRLPVGFFWPRDAAESRPDAWCAECEERVKTTGGEWIGGAGEQLGVSVLCAVCYDEARELNLRGRPGSRAV
jgi:hypothetical protein